MSGREEGEDVGEEEAVVEVEDEEDGVGSGERVEEAVWRTGRVSSAKAGVRGERREERRMRDAIRAKKGFMMCSG